MLYVARRGAVDPIPIKKRPKTRDHSVHFLPIPAFRMNADPAATPTLADFRAFFQDVVLPRKQRFDTLMKEWHDWNAQGRQTDSPNTNDAFWGTRANGFFDWWYSTADLLNYRMNGCLTKAYLKNGRKREVELVIAGFADDELHLNTHPCFDSPVFRAKFIAPQFVILRNHVIHQLRIPDFEKWVWLYKSLLTSTPDVVKRILKDGKVGAGQLMNSTYRMGKKADERWELSTRLTHSVPCIVQDREEPLLTVGFSRGEWSVVVSDERRCYLRLGRVFHKTAEGLEIEVRFPQWMQDQDLHKRKLDAEGPAPV